MSTTGVPLPPPFKGQSDLLPPAALQNPYAEVIENYNNQGGIIKLRQGHSNVYKRTSVGAGRALNVTSYGEYYLFFCLQDGANVYWYDLTSGAGVLVYTSAQTANSEFATLQFKDYLFYMGFASNAVVQYAAGVWGLAGYTFPANFYPLGGCVYKNRAYFIDGFDSKFGYTNINAITGTVTEVDQSALISTPGRLFGIRSISLGENVTQENVLAFLYNTGEVLVYAGSYPESQNWQQISRFNISPMLGFNSFVDCKGDSILFTKTEVLSLRNIFTNGYSQERTNGIGKDIKKRYSQIIQAYISASSFAYLQQVTGVYDATNDRLIINFPVKVDRDGDISFGDSMQLIYDFNLEAWFEYWGRNFAYTYPSACYFSGGVYVAVDNGGTFTGVMKLEGRSDYMDAAFSTSSTYGITYRLKSAPHPVSKFGVIKAEGIEVLMKTDLYDETSLKIVGDLGAIETSPQTTSGPSTMHKAWFDVGIEANFIQYDINGLTTASSVGQEIHATNLWVTPSEGLVR